MIVEMIFKTKILLTKGEKKEEILTNSSHICARVKFEGDFQ